MAGGHSKFVCIYNVQEQMLMKKFEISCNLSFDAMEVKAKVLSRPREAGGVGALLMHRFSCRSSWTGGR